jgi:Rrf2 family transcriptional regulator, iron-sulfur cluster assembly transcription factor
MISNTCKYAIRAVIYISMNQQDGKNVGIKEISQNLEMPSPFLSKILQQLAKKKVLNSIKGPNGGFTLAASPDELTVWEIVEIIDGTDLFKDCFLGLNMCHGDKNVKSYCPAHPYSEPIRAELERMFKGLTITKFAEDLITNSAFIKL